MSPVAFPVFPTGFRASFINTGKLVFAQVMAHLPLTIFRRCVARYRREHKVKQFSCFDHFLCMVFAQLTYRESLRDIETCLRSQVAKLNHMGFRIILVRNKIANANAARNWRICADFAQHPIDIARGLYVREFFCVEPDNTAFALAATIINLCLSVFPWAPFRSTKAAVKLRTLLDLHGNISRFIHISDGRWREVNIFGLLIPEAGAFYVMDRGHIDFDQLHRLYQVYRFFVIRAKSNLCFQRCHLRPSDRANGLMCDQIGTLTGVSVLVAIVRKPLNLSASLYDILQILSLTLIERTPLD